jgi:hypothetical protein
MIELDALCSIVADRVVEGWKVIRVRRKNSMAESKSQEHEPSTCSLMSNATRPIIGSDLELPKSQTTCTEGPKIPEKTKAFVRMIKIFKRS